MVNTCCVTGCKMGYKSVKVAEKTPLFKFPKNEELRNRWKKSIPRQNWIVNDNHRVCAKHFCEDDFICTSSNSKMNRRVHCDSQILTRLRLKPTAAPKIFSEFTKLSLQATTCFLFNNKFCILKMQCRKSKN